MADEHNWSFAVHPVDGFGCAWVGSWGFVNRLGFVGSCFVDCSCFVCFGNCFVWVGNLVGLVVGNLVGLVGSFVGIGGVGRCCLVVVGIVRIVVVGFVVVGTFVVGIVVVEHTKPSVVVGTDM